MVQKSNVETQVMYLEVADSRLFLPPEKANIYTLSR